MRMNLRQKVSANNFQCTEKSFHIDVLPSSLLGSIRMFTECLKRVYLENRLIRKAMFTCIFVNAIGSVLILWRSNTVYCYDVPFQAMKGPKVAASHITICNYSCKPVTLDIGSFILKLRGISFYCSSIQT